MTLTTVWSTITKILDICILWYIVYFALKNLKNNIKMVLIFKGIVFIVIIKIISNLLNLYAVGLLLEYVIMWGPLAVIIIFQPEIRTVLEQLGRSQLLGRHKVLSGDERRVFAQKQIRCSHSYRKRCQLAGVHQSSDKDICRYIVSNFGIVVLSEQCITRRRSDHPRYESDMCRMCLQN